MSISGHAQPILKRDNFIISNRTDKKLGIQSRKRKIIWDSTEFSNWVLTKVKFIGHLSAVFSIKALCQAEKPPYLKN